MINICGLWLNKNDNTLFASGNLGRDCRVLVFKNDKRGNDKAPDYRLVFTENKKQEKKMDVPEEQPEFPDTSMSF